MRILALDFETYFDAAYSLRKMSIPEYVHDSRFYVHGVALRWPDGRLEFRTNIREALEELQSEFGKELERTTVVCHNAYFDLYVLNHHYGVRPRHFIDTMLLAYHVHGRPDRSGGERASLESLARRYGLEPKGSLDFMRGVRHPSVRQFADLADYAKHDAQLAADLVLHLLPEITRPGVELPILMHTVRLFTERAVHVDVPGIDQLQADIEAATAATLQEAEVGRDELSSNLRYAGRLEVALAATGRRVALKQGKRGMIPAIAKTDAEMQALLHDDDPTVAALARARLEQRGQDQKIARLETMRRIAHATGGKLPPYLVYYGAHTGRFAGGGKFNVQNLGSEGTGGRIRELLRPQPGHVFVIADFAQIEARITAWLSGEDDILRAFRDRHDLYSEFASRTLGEPVRKPREGDSVELKARLKALRQVGKRAVLGLGFGMGALKFMNTLRKDKDAARLFATGDLTPLGCREIVQTFRDAYSAIPQFWAALEAALRDAVDGEATDVSRLHVEPGSPTRIWLPSGRAFRYPDLRLDFTARTIRYMDECGTESESLLEGPSLVFGRDTSLYGGKLCENVVQATARDILVEAILRLERCGLPVAFHVHDEVIVEVPEAAASDAARQVEAELNEIPAWASGLPIACEVSVRDRYGEMKAAATPPNVAHQLAAPTFDATSTTS